MINRSLKTIVLVTILIFINACAHPVLVVGKTSESIEPDSVQLFYTQRPGCEFETVGYLRIEGGSYSLSSLFKRMQNQAAELGANGVYVIETRRLDILEYIGTARAIRCLEV